MQINRWWDADPEEIYWLETTDREDLGIDLNAPQVGEKGQEVWSYWLVNEISEGDIVLHYLVRPHFEIVAWSRAVGEAYTDDVFWGAHGMASGRGPVEPYWRPGFRIGLEGPYDLPEPVTLDRLRKLESAVAGVRDDLNANVRGTTYFPFAIRKDGLRGTQAYLTKFPRALFDAIPELRDLPAAVNATAPQPGNPAPSASATQLGEDYVDELEDWETAERKPFSIDPNVVDRGLKGHKRTQNLLAQHLREEGHSPRRAAAGEPQFDLAWEAEDVIYVAEIKSRTDSNEERQLRLGLGQVLRYAHQLSVKGKMVRPVLVLEHEPQDHGWYELCKAHGVALLWPDNLTMPKLA